MIGRLGGVRKRKVWALKSARSDVAPQREVEVAQKGVAAQGNNLKQWGEWKGEDELSWRTEFENEERGKQAVEREKRKTAPVLSFGVNPAGQGS